MTARRTPLTDISNNSMTPSPAASGSRRKSGRAVKAPEKFVPDAPTSQVVPASSKRKRTVDDIENGASESEEEEEEESDDAAESAAEEELKGTRKKSKPARKPAAKKPKVNGTASHQSAPAVKLPTRPKKAKKVAIADKEAEGLYAEIYTSGHHTDDVAATFINDYREAAPAALTELVNMVLKSAGCDIQVTEDDINDVDNVEAKLGELQEEFQAQNITDYPLISKAKSSHDFRNALVDFFTALVTTMGQTNIMYDEEVLIENITNWFVTMSSSSSRPFRHTATLVNLTTTSAMCSLAREELEKAAKIRQQVKSEHKKGANKARNAQFHKNIEASEKKYEFLLTKINDNFDTVYVHRYRDVDPKIRLECVDGLGNWIRTLPDHFSEGTYLRYMGWMLSDTHAPMRQGVVNQLYNIMKNPDIHHNMGTFIERFRQRIVEIATRDSEPTVRSAAVALADTIRQAGMLEPDDIDTVGKLIFDSELIVRKAVVNFFIAGVEEAYEAKIEELGGPEELEVLAVDEDDTTSPRKEWIKLKALAETLALYDTEDQDELPNQVNRSADTDFLNISHVESRFTLAAQVLYERMGESKDWDILASYLLFDHSAKPRGNSKTLRTIIVSFKPTDKEEIILLEILNAVVKLGLTHIDESEKGKKKTKDELSEAKESTARRLANLIPRLLKKYGATPHTSKIILRLEHVLNLGVFQELRQDSTAYAKLLDDISNQFTTHADRGVLAEAGAAILHARGFEELEEVTEIKVQSLWEDTINTLNKINKVDDISQRGGFREPVLVELSHNLARLDKLSSISNCVEPLESNVEDSQPSPIAILIDIIARGVFEQESPGLDASEDEVVLSAIRSAMFYFMWKVRSLTESISAGNALLEIEIDNLKDIQEVFITNLIAALSSRATNDPVRLFATGTLLDLHVLFATLRPARIAKSKAGEAKTRNELLQTLVKEIAPEVQAELTSIFDTAERTFAKKSRRKLAEPGEDEAPEDLDSEEDDDDDENATESERRSEILKAEQHLCELTGKLVLAILAKVIDVSGESAGKLSARIQRNRTRLGANFRDVVAYLDDPKSKVKRSHKSKAQQAAIAARKSEKSRELAEEEGEEDDPFDEAEPEEGTVEDLRRRELEEDLPASEDGDGATEIPAEGDEDEVMGD